MDRRVGKWMGRMRDSREFLYYKDENRDTFVVVEAGFRVDSPWVLA